MQSPGLRYWWRLAGTHLPHLFCASSNLARCRHVGFLVRANPTGRRDRLIDEIPQPDCAPFFSRGRCFKKNRSHPAPHSKRKKKQLIYSRRHKYANLSSSSVPQLGILYVIDFAGAFFETCVGAYLSVRSLAESALTNCGCVVYARLIGRNE